MQVVFYTVKDALSKVQVLLKTVDEHFYRKEKIKILVSDAQALRFVSDLLWNSPKEAFRPHSLMHPESFQDLILLTFSPTDMDGYPIAFNLSSEPSLSHKLIYELEDLSHPQKTLIFQKKFSFYQKNNYTLSSKPI